MFLNPFYVDFPRNRYGEHLTQLPFAIKNMLESHPRKEVEVINPRENSNYITPEQSLKEFKVAESRAKELNRIYSAEIMAIQI